MLSKKMAFSLMSLIAIFALAFVAPSAIAQFEIGLSVSTDADLSFADGNQVVYDTATTILIMSAKVVNSSVATATTAALETNAVVSGTALGADDFTIIAYNPFGGTVAIDTNNTAEAVVVDLTLQAVGAEGPANGINFMMNLDSVAAPSPAPGADDYNPSTHITRVLIVLPAKAVELADPRAEMDATTNMRKPAGQNKEASIELHFVSATEGNAISEENEDVGKPTVHSIMRADGMLRPVTAATFDVLITLSEEPRKDGFKKDHIDAANATAGDPVFLDKMAESTEADGMKSSGRDMMLYRYIVTLTPKYANKNDIVVKVKSFYDQEKQMLKMYMPPATAAGYMEGMDKLTVKVGKEVLKAGTAGYEVVLAKELFIPSDGYLVVADDAAGSAIINPGGAKDAPPVTRSPEGLKYNLNAIALPNLETFLANGGVIDVVSPMSLTISEIMWGSDASIAVDNSKSQWIELHNSGAGANTLDDDAATAADEATHLIFYGYGQAPAATVNADGTMTLPAGVKDRVGTIGAKGGVWSIAGKGQSGRTGTGEAVLELTAVAPTQPLISMYRIMVPSTAVGATAGAMMPGDGTMASSWMASSPPPVNFKLDAVGVRIASPGASPIVTTAAQAAADAAAAAKASATAAAAAKAADTSVMMPMNGTIYISEVMFAGGGSLPQWIEISNGSRSEQVNLSGWTLTVENATADADISVGAKAVFTIPEGTMIDPSGQKNTPSTLLIVTEVGRNNIDNGAMGASQILNLWTDQQTELILLGVTKRKYSLLSGMAFMITLAPPVPIVAPAAATPAPTTAAGIAAARTAAAAKKAADATAALARKAATDMVGNLGAAGTATWALPMGMDGDARSSIIRRHVQVSIGAAEPEDGMMMDSWALASDTAFAQVTHIRASSYYGSANDVGTPGFRAGGALPVELSHFRPARNKDTGAVVITWSTQSELNNAGFFIKRSNQPDSEFKVINPTMIAGAGTTSEKQFYTYTDMTAQPNVVYYYQIEDVSLDGNRQTLTRGIRLKGHVSVAGKATLTWGELKTSQ